MNDHDVLDTLQGSMDGVSMPVPVEQIVQAGRRRQRRRFAAVTAAAAAGMAGVALAVAPAPGSGGEGVHIRTVAYTVDSQQDGTVRVTWDKQRYFTDHDGLQAALRDAGFPVLIKVGEFCRGPQDAGDLDRSGVGPGVDAVMRGVRAADDRVTFVFTPSAMPTGTELFIGYLTPEQVARAGGSLGSVERLVPTGVPLTCTTQPPAGRPPSPGGAPAGK